MTFAHYTYLPERILGARGGGVAGVTSVAVELEGAGVAEEPGVTQEGGVRVTARKSKKFKAVVKFYGLLHIP